MDSETIMFDFSGFYDRIAELMPDDCRIAEVGVANCDSVIYLAKKLIEKGKKFKIYAIDDMSYGKYIQQKTIYENLIKNKVAEYVEVIPKPSLEAVKDFNDGYLNCVFIDSSHTYPETKHEVFAWYDKVIDRGILCGHDAYAEGVGKSIKEVIPEQLKRDDIPDRDFPEEQFLHIEDTTNHYGVWWVEKDFWKKLNKIA